MAKSPGLILNSGKLLGAACMQAVLEEESRYAANVTYRKLCYVFAGFLGCEGRLLCHKLVTMPVVHNMSRTVIIPSQSRCVKMILSQRVLSDGGLEAGWCSMSS